MESIATYFDFSGSFTTFGLEVPDLKSHLIKMKLQS